MLGELKRAEAGIQLFLKFLDSGSPPPFGGVTRNDYRFTSAPSLRHSRPLAPLPSGCQDRAQSRYRTTAASEPLSATSRTWLRCSQRL